MSIYENPFPEADNDRYTLWEMLVARDIKAFLACNWDAIADDFVETEFMAIDGRFRSNPDSWTLAFPTLQDYKRAWLSQSKDFAATEWAGDVREGLYEATNLRDIEIAGHCALVHKKLDGVVIKKNGDRVALNWQTLYRCRKVNDRWKIAGFTGYLPHPMGHASNVGPVIREPDHAEQHVTAGPYSPVLELDPGRIVVISGQAALNKAGETIGSTIEEQTRVTLENCSEQLKAGGCSLGDVFKVNVYLKDLDHWPRFNEVYKTYFTAPLPVRTAVQTGLLGSFLVEIELWAIKK
jgi:enamine deaminase RidA (YjgF/YER057c/UK114 family)